MKRLVLLVINQEYQTRLNQFLGEHYNLLKNIAKIDPRYVNACIVDASGLQENRTQISDWQSYPLDRPALLYVGSVESLNEESRSFVDDVLCPPFTQAEALMRVKNMLQVQKERIAHHRTWEQLLQASKAVESTSDAITIADMSGKIIYNNPAFIKLFGYTSQEVNAIGISSALCIDKSIIGDIFQTTQQQENWRDELDLRAKNGAIIPVLLQADCITNGQNKPIGIIAVCTDIRDRQQAEIAEHEQRVFAEALRDTAAALTCSLDLNDVFDLILDNIKRVVPHAAVNIMLINGDDAQVIRQRGYPHYISIDEKYDINATNDLRHIIQDGNPLILQDTYGCKWTKHSPFLASHLGLPIYLHGDISGFLNVDHIEPDYFDEYQVKNLQIFVEQAAIAIQNARLFKQAQSLAALEERHSIARDLHDAVSQTLFSASLIADVLPQLWQQEPEKVITKLDDLRRMTRGALAEMRVLLLELRPEKLIDAELPILLQQLASAVMGRTHLEIDLAYSEVTSFDDDTKIALYYITHEALNNVVKHANAQKVKISLTREVSAYQLVIEDNGVGFDVAEVCGSGLGLCSMRERAEAIGAYFTVHSEPQQGTSIHICSNTQHKQEEKKDDSYKCNSRIDSR